ncbi:uncharacterized protein [Antedon mediterranea]|uniref:uncharacterized protein isoform X5 n=1 Tax=Antedon mediterranea TaxID=105859 RepID=UPI003AF5E993
MALSFEDVFRDLKKSGRIKDDDSSSDEETATILTTTEIGTIRSGNSYSEDNSNKTTFLPTKKIATDCNKTLFTKKTHWYKLWGRRRRRNCMWTLPIGQMIQYLKLVMKHLMWTLPIGQTIQYLKLVMK